jgi:hypothetical protein
MVADHFAGTHTAGRAKAAKPRPKTGDSNAAAFLS